MLTRNALGLAVIAGLALPTFAQDSVAPGLGTEDAVDAYLTGANGTQRLLYTVRPGAITSTRGKTYGFFPIAKASGLVPADTATFDNGLMSGNAISRDTRSSAVFSNGFADWTTAGQGVSPNENDAAQTVDIPGGEVVSLGYGFSEFSGGGVTLDVANLVTGQIAYSVANPGVIYVSRGYAAHNSDNPVAGQFNASFGFNSIDADLVSTFRSDNFGISGDDEVSGNNIFRVFEQARDLNSINEIRGSGVDDAPATNEIIRGSGTTFTVPSSVPTSLGGPAYFGPNFNTQLVFENTPLSTMTTTVHRNGSNDHRGGISFVPGAFYEANDVLTAAIHTKGAGNQTTAINAWGAAANGQPDAGNFYPTPDSTLDPLDGRTLNRGEQNHVGSQTAFSGGPQVGIGFDAAGNLLIAGTYEALQLPAAVPGDAADDAAQNVVLVGRIDPQNPGVADWSVAGYVDPNFGGNPNHIGKLVRDENGNTVGEMYPFQLLGLADPGPSISAPAIDSAGNVYFTGVVRFYGTDGLRDDASVSGPFVDDFVEVSVIRANYVADTGSDSDLDGTNDFGFELEVLLSVGDIFTSPGTGLEYRINGIELEDSNSIASAAMYANGVTSAPFGADTDTVNTGAEDADSLGGLVVSVGLAYDVDGDGAFGSADGVPGGFDADDQEYTLLGLILPQAGEPTFPDCNNNGTDDADDIAMGTSLDINSNGIPDECETADRLCADASLNGIVSPTDFGAWLAAFNAGNFVADVNQDGAVTPTDFGAWLGAFNQGQNGPLCLPLP